MFENLRKRLEALYFGGSRDAIVFQYVIVAFDIFTVGFFVATSFVDETSLILTVEYALAVGITADFAARFWIARHKRRFLMDLVNIADLIVIATLLAAAFVENWAFLRVLRALRILRSYHLLRDFRDRSTWFRRNEDVLGSSLNLVVFVFFVTALVYVLEVDTESNINSYMDALYFTVTALTTTGFGDITLQGTHGRLLSVAVMVVGVALFLRLVQTIFQPSKVRHRCESCGLSRHEPDAVHCKHCGRTLNIETEGP